jgi:hypothetical protein
MALAGICRDRLGGARRAAHVDRRFNQHATKHDSYAQFPIDTWEPEHPADASIKMSKREIGIVVALLKTYVAALG